MRKVRLSVKKARLTADSLLILGLMLLILPARPSLAAEMDIPFTLSKPAGDGPFPAVVILHDCSGLGPYSSGAPWRWSTRLVALGYVTIWPDSFSTRGFPDGICVVNSRNKVNYQMRAADAYAALTYLRGLPYVDRERVAVMGGSHGGSATLATIVIETDDAQNGFAAAIALYPNCFARFADWYPMRDKPQEGPVTDYHGIFKPRAPLLILAGELDDWTPVEPCRHLAADARDAGYPVDIIVYPGAHHAFDSRAPVKFNAARRNPNAPNGYGATTGGNRQAWADAIIQVENFLARYLTK